MPDMLNWACDVDVYDIWAEMLVHDNTLVQPKRKYSVGYASRRNEKTYKYTLDEIRQMYGSHILVDLEVPKVLAAAMGDHTCIFRHEDENKMMEIMYAILER